MHRDLIDKSRIVEEFKYLVSLDSESFGEAEISAYLKEKLVGLGLTVTEDEAKALILEKHPEYVNAASNIYARLEGTRDGEALFFCSHMDTVRPGIGKKAIVHEDGRITSDGNTVLGADDVSGIVSILEALRIIQENHISHPEIEVIFTVAEEPYCEGSKYLDYVRIHAEIGYVLDLVGPVGTAALAAPSILSVIVDIEGKASHAGFAPEDGINALDIVVAALGKIPTGHVDADTTVNFGTIQGGQGKNIVPDHVHIEGEIRSLVHEKAVDEAKRIEAVFAKEAEALDGHVKIEIIEHIKAYHNDTDSEVVSTFQKAFMKTGIDRDSVTITTYGGSDANRLNANGKRTIVLANAMENCHSKEEYTTVEELINSTLLTLQLMIQED